MGVNKKNKRRLVYSKRVFYWRVQQDAEDFGHINLQIVSEDKKFIVTYRADQSKQNRSSFIVIQGTEFEGLNNFKKGWTRVLTPKWEDELITPGLVRRIIEWCFSHKEGLVLIDWQGNIIS